MPAKNGIQLCKEIKSDFRTSHIPIILLSANADIEQKIEGLESGADSYIVKPFHSKQLLVEVSNLIKLREKIRNHFRKNINFQPGELNIPSIDENFITHCLEIVENNLEEPSFNVLELARELNISRTQLFRKLKALIGQSPADFIYSARLKKAARLLMEKQYSVSEVAYKTGFSNPGSFSTAFRRYFGKSPSKYLE